MNSKFRVVDVSEKSNPLLRKEPHGKNLLAVLRKHKIDTNPIFKIRRCKKCILPETTPFINFNKQGICNYCDNYEKEKYFGLKKLKADIKISLGSSKRCLVGFSGGRDSSYGLHYVKKVLGLDPIAFTYDWGMMTDLGRRNQSRILSKLGVEHVLISAEISKKRLNIKKNVEAWMKNPSLGMIPLFMGGDKQTEYYADQVMKDMKIPLMFFFRGNSYEKEEFKAGHAGIFGADPGGIIHDLGIVKTIKLGSYYGWQYLKNPSYFNGSFFDSIFGFFSTFVQSHSYLFLWHYIPWDEDEVVGTLKKEYGWETIDENISTWRTDDASSAFYNYIYYQVQGFTENDSFRSHQIRAGVMSRKKAIELVKKENQPRYKALKWYFDTVGLDGDEVLSVVDKMPKLY